MLIITIVIYCDSVQKLKIMILVIGIIGVILFTVILWGLSDIKIELRYKNTLTKEQNNILKDIYKKL